MAVPPAAKSWSSTASSVCMLKKSTLPCFAESEIAGVAALVMVAIVGRQCRNNASFSDCDQGAGGAGTLTSSIETSMRTDRAPALS